MNKILSCLILALMVCFCGCCKTSPTTTTSNDHYELVVAGPHAVYKINKMTGDVTFISGSKSVEVTPDYGIPGRKLTVEELTNGLPTNTNATR